MVLKPDQERVKTLLKDTITLLCRNGLEFKQNFAVDAVIGVTLDEDEVFLVSINEIVKSESYKAPDSQEHQHEDSAKTSGIPRKRRKHHRVKQAKDVSSVDVSTDGEESETFSAFAEGAQQNESLSKKEPQSDEEESDDLVMIKEELDNWDNSAHDNTSNSPGNLQPFFGDLAEAGSSHSQNFDMSQAQSSGNTGAWPFPGDLSYGSDPSIASPGQFPLRGREPSALGADTSQGQGPQQVLDLRKKRGSVRVYFCDLCSYTSKRAYNLQRHQRSVHVHASKIVRWRRAPKLPSQDAESEETLPTWHIPQKIDPYSVTIPNEQNDRSSPGAAEESTLT